MRLFLPYCAGLLSLICSHVLQSYREGLQLLCQAYNSDPRNPAVLNLLAHYCLTRKEYAKVGFVTLTKCSHSTCVRTCSARDAACKLCLLYQYTDLHLASKPCIMCNLGFMCNSLPVSKHKKLKRPKVGIATTSYSVLVLWSCSLPY